MIDLITEHYNLRREHFVKKMSYSCGMYAEDAVQEAYTRCIMYKDAFNKEKDFDKWFNRILHNTSLEYRRFNAGMSMDSVEDEEDLPLLEDGNFDERLKFELHSDIDAILNPVEQEVVKLHFIYGYPTRAIAQITGVSKRNVNHYLFKFRTNTKAKYQ